jgi:hypothetical protein
MTRAIDATCDFAAFTEKNDPHFEHDFGNFELDGETLFWKIDLRSREPDHGLRGSRGYGTHEERPHDHALRRILSLDQPTLRRACCPRGGGGTRQPTFPLRHPECIAQGASWNRNFAGELRSRSAVQRKCGIGSEE